MHDFIFVCLCVFMILKVTQLCPKGKCLSSVCVCVIICSSKCIRWGGGRAARKENMAG